MSHGYKSTKKQGIFHDKWQNSKKADTNCLPILMRGVTHYNNLFLVFSDLLAGWMFNAQQLAGG